MTIFESYYRLPGELFPGETPGSASPEAVFAVTDAIKVLYAGRKAGTSAPQALAGWVEERLHSTEGPLVFPCSIDALIDDLRLERYHVRAHPPDGRMSMKSLIKSVYYLVRPLLPVAVRKHLQRFMLKDWQGIAFPEWPVDTTVETILAVAVTAALREHAGDIPFIWFWPDGHDACAIMTHDVETAAGRDFCGTLMDMEERVGITSSFEVVPERRYEVTETYLSSIRARGCEICLHGLNHDGRLFSTKEILIERAKKINEYAVRFGAIGFRSPVMYRNVDWFKYFDFKYDMSMPNVAHLDPQRGGCCSVMPYSVGDLLELPLTTTQDYPLFHNLERYDMALWNQQIEVILQKHGLISFIMHPDYTVPLRAQDLYRQLLGHLAELRDVRNVWIPLPREVYAWWTERNGMRLVREAGRWRIEGKGKERASIAWLHLEGGSLVYRRQ
jgi:hypothetical protein